MKDAAVVRASFTDYRTVKSRGVLQIICEIPIERQAEVFAALGYPMPHEDRWVAIALLRDPGKIPESRRPEEILIPPEDHRATSPPPPAGAHAKDLGRSMAAKEHYASLDERARAVADAGRLANDELFQRFASKKSGLPPSVELAASVIRSECGVGSRKHIALSKRAYAAFRALVTEFEIETGRRAAPR